MIVPCPTTVTNTTRRSRNPGPACDGAATARSVAARPPDDYAAALRHARNVAVVRCYGRSMVRLLSSPRRRRRLKRLGIAAAVVAVVALVAALIPTHGPQKPSPPRNEGLAKLLVSKHEARRGRRSSGDRSHARRLHPGCGRRRRRAHRLALAGPEMHREHDLCRLARVERTRSVLSGARSSFQTGRSRRGHPTTSTSTCSSIRSPATSSATWVFDGQMVAPPRSLAREPSLHDRDHAAGAREQARDRTGRFRRSGRCRHTCRGAEARRSLVPRVAAIDLASSCSCRSRASASSPFGGGPAGARTFAPDATSCRLSPRPPSRAQRDGIGRPTLTFFLLPCPSGIHDLDE